MGNQIRVPKEIYFEGGVLKFFAKNKQIHYIIKIWTKDGMKQFVFEQGKFDGKIVTAQDIIDRTKSQFVTIHKEGSQSHESEMRD